MGTVEYGVHRLDNQHDETYGLPAVCLVALTGPGLPSLRITPTGTQPADWSGLIDGQRRIVFENGPDHASRMAFPTFNPADARQPDWKTRRRPPGDPGHSGCAPVPREDPANPPRSIHDRLAPMRTMAHHFGRHHVVYPASLFPHEPTVIIRHLLGPGLPNLSITREGAVSHDGTGLDEGKGQLNLHIAITREDLL
jgi:hypothetical protein